MAELPVVEGYIVADGRSVVGLQWLELDEVRSVCRLRCASRAGARRGAARGRERL